MVDLKVTFERRLEEDVYLLYYAPKTSACHEFFILFIYLFNLFGCVAS